MATKRVPKTEPALQIKAPKKRAPRKPKEEKAIELRIPPAVEGSDQWLICGLDPSLSNTGYAFLLVTRGEDRSNAKWLEVGSVKPEDASDPVWVRSKAIAMAVRGKLGQVMVEHIPPEQYSKTGLIVSFEAPTPGNDFLTSISRILHLVLLGQGSIASFFGRVHIQMTNAATLRRLMGLTKTGNKNKTENIARAYNFLDQGSYPNLDTDACDAVLMSMMARYVAAILMGFPNTIPARFLEQFCNAEEEIKGKGRNARTRVKGTFYRPEYWSQYERKDYAVAWRDAKQKKSRLDRTIFSI